MDRLLKEEIQQKAFLNLPYIYSNICVIYPLTMKEIVSMGQVNYSSYLSILSMEVFDIIRNAEKKGVILEPDKINVLQFLIESARQDYSFLLELKNAFRTFIREEVIILFDEYKIVIGDGTDKRILDNNNFGEFQNIIRVQNKREVKEVPPANETPLQKKFRLKAEYRDAIKRQQKANDPDAPDFCSLMNALCIYSGITPQQLQQYSFFAFKDSFDANQLRDKYDIDIRSLLAGADPKKVKPSPWIKKTN